ncbi:MAG: hypothetical protein Q8N83_01520 [Ignavibacteria bacterium]|nr:hypothetical protein [Ignavibacteria bacterium]
MDNNRSITWCIREGDYINIDIDYELGQKIVKKRKRLLGMLYQVGFGALSFVLMLIVLQLVSKV